MDGADAEALRTACRSQLSSSRRARHGDLSSAASVCAVCEHFNGEGRSSSDGAHNLVKRAARAEAEEHEIKEWLRWAPSIEAIEEHFATPPQAFFDGVEGAPSSSRTPFHRLAVQLRLPACSLSSPPVSGLGGVLRYDRSAGAWWWSFSLMVSSTLFVLCRCN